MNDKIIKKNTKQYSNYSNEQCYVGVGKIYIQTFQCFVNYKNESIIHVKFDLDWISLDHQSQVIYRRSLYAFYRKEKEKEKGEGEGLHLKLSNFTAGEMLFHKVSQRPFMTVGCQGASFGAELCKHLLFLLHSKRGLTICFKKILFKINFYIYFRLFIKNNFKKIKKYFFNILFFKKPL